MFEKFVAIKNVGRFKNYGAAGDVACKKCTLIYAENGHGKSTLSTIIRSLHENNPGLVIGRKTLGSKDDITILVRANNVTYEFKNGSWSSSLADVEIFDADFIANNVYAGSSIEHEHKKNLYKFAL